MKIALIAGREITLGYGLAGVKEFSISSSHDEAAAALRSFSNDTSIGIILVEESLGMNLHEEIKKIRDRNHVYPVIIMIPDWNEGKK